MLRILARYSIVVAVVALAGCGIYTFSGSTLPTHLKTVDIPLFGNQSLQPEIAEEITAAVNREVLATNLLRVVGSGGDATITGVVTGYKHHPYTYESSELRSVDVSEYAVTVTVDVQFMDNKKGKALYQGRVTGEGVYDVEKETEEVGRDRALKEIIEQIIQNSVQSW